MDQVRLGRSELVVSRLGFGCAALSGYDYGPIDEAEAIRAIRRAHDLDVTLFDTADVYGFGRSEELLSEALGNARDKVVVATKGGIAWDARGRTRRDASPRHLRDALDASLARLKLEAVSLYQVHWLDDRTPLGDVVETLSSFQREGKVVHAGICNVGPEDLSVAQAHGRLECLQLPLSLVEREHGDGLEAAARIHGMGTLAYNVLGQGLLTGATPDPATLHSSDLRFRSHLFQQPAYTHGRRAYEQLTEEAEALARSPAQLAIRWVLEQEHVTAALVGAKTRRQVEDNAGAVGWSIDRATLRRLDGLGPRVAGGPATGGADPA